MVSTGFSDRIINLIQDLEHIPTKDLEVDLDKIKLDDQISLLDKLSKLDAEIKVFLSEARPSEKQNVFVSIAYKKARFNLGVVTLPPLRKGKKENVWSSLMSEWMQDIRIELAKKNQTDQMIIADNSLMRYALSQLISSKWSFVKYCTFQSNRYSDIDTVKEKLLEELFKKTEV